MLNIEWAMIKSEKALRRLALFEYTKSEYTSFIVNSYQIVLILILVNSNGYKFESVANDRAHF